MKPLCLLKYIVYLNRYILRKVILSWSFHFKSGSPVVCCITHVKDIFLETGMGEAGEWGVQEAVPCDVSQPADTDRCN